LEVLILTDGFKRVDNIDALVALSPGRVMAHITCWPTRESAHILLEGTPPGFGVGDVEMHLTGIVGVSSIHHVHAWSLTGESPIVTLHAELSDEADRQQVLAAILNRLRERLNIEHATVQIEYGPCNRAWQSR
jgi:cobalt-zinc-cadmium efflux system protein